MLWILSKCIAGVKVCVQKKVFWYDENYIPMNRLWNNFPSSELFSEYVIQLIRKLTTYRD